MSNKEQQLLEENKSLKAEVYDMSKMLVNRNDFIGEIIKVLGLEGEVSGAVIIESIQALKNQGDEVVDAT